MLHLANLTFDENQRALVPKKKKKKDESVVSDLAILVIGCSLAFKSQANLSPSGLPTLSECSAVQEEPNRAACTRHYLSSCYYYMKLVVVGIGGPSSSGKTTVAKALHSLYPSSTLVHLDDFYYPDEQIPVNEEIGVQNWDCADAINWAKFKKYIEAVRLSNGAFLPVESLEMDALLKLSEEETENLSALAYGQVPASEFHFVFVDGFMIFHSDEISRLFDVKLFFRAPYEVLKARRESRLGYNTVEGFWVDPPNYFDNIVWPEFVKSHRQLFVGEDVTKDLTDAARKSGLADIVNGDATTLVDLIKWAIGEIAVQVRML